MLGVCRRMGVPWILGAQEPHWRMPLWLGLLLLLPGLVWLVLVHVWAGVLWVLAAEYAAGGVGWCLLLALPVLLQL